MLAEEEINSAGKMKIKIIFEDTQSISGNSVNAYIKLTTADNVPVVMPFLSGETAPLVPLGERDKVIIFSPTATTSVLATGGNYSFKLRESNSVHAGKITDVMLERNDTKIGLIYSNVEACKDFVRFFKSSAVLKNITIVTEELYESKATDMRTQLEKIKESNTSAFYTCGLYQDLALVFKQAKEIGVNKKGYSFTTFENNKLFELAGNGSVEGVIYTVSQLDCKNAASFCGNYRKIFKSEPDYRAAFDYDGVRLVARAIETNGYSVGGIMQGLLAIKNFTGASGTTSFDAEGNAQKDVVVHIVKDGKFVEYS